MLKAAIKRLPPIAALVAERDALLKACGMAPPGHFYSPIVALAEADRDASRIFGEAPRQIAGIDMNEPAQLELLSQFEAMYDSIDIPETKAESYRYFFENPAYSYSDAIMLHCMMRHCRPRQIVEVGCGYSSCLMLDTSERYLDDTVEMTFIEPFPALLKSLVRPDDFDRCEVIPRRLQDTPLTVFDKLGAGDFLFIDSTHVCKTGSDVNFLLFEVLPRLRRGVYVHVHDIFYPFEYPKEWVYGGRSWNEIYALRAFLQFNSAFRIELMNTFLEHFHEERFAARMPLCLRNRGGSLWLSKRTDA